MDPGATAEGLGAASLTAAQLSALVSRIASAGPLEVPALAHAFEKNRDAGLGGQLFSALQKSSGTENLTLDPLRRLLADSPEEVRRSAEPLFARLSAGIEQQRSRLSELAGLLVGGDPARGRGVF